MVFVVGIRCDNDAFDFERFRNDEVSRILRDLADRVDEGGNYFPLLDINGHRVGGAEFRRRYASRVCIDLD